MREFARLAPGEEFLLYHQLPVPPSLPAPAANMRLRRLDIPGDRWHLWELVRLPLALLRDRPRVYHGTCNTLPPLLPCPGVVTLHDVIVLWWPDDLADAYVRHCRRVTRRAVAGARIVLTVSEYSRREILRRFRPPEEKVRVFHNGIQPLFLEDPAPGEVAETRARLALDRPYLFAIGAPLRRKNTAALVAAAGELARTPHRDHLLALSGLSPEERRPFAEQADRLGLAAKLRFLPYLEERELRNVYAGADLFVYPSLAEGWGIPVVESMAAGTPVACSRTTAIPEAGGPHAAYFDPENPAEIAAVVREVLDHPARWREQRPAAQERARSFRWDRAAAATLDAYRAAAGESP
jgi:alpha-1,3-rhamnosyl/mannosyltransferase